MPTPEDEHSLVKTLRQAYGGDIATFRRVLGGLQPDDRIDQYLVHGSVVSVIADGVVKLQERNLLADLSTWRRLAAEVSLYEDELLELAARWGHAVAFTPSPEPGEPPELPYKDLAPFTRNDAAIFFGRRQTIQEILLALTNSRPPVVLLFGPTGVGKSSLLQAGVLPRAGSAFHAVYVQYTVSTTLLDSARRGLAGEGSLRAAWAAREREHGRPVVLILDQVESVYTTDRGEESGVVQLAQLLAALLDEDQDIKVLGKLVLGVRKEWLAEVRRPFVERQLSPRHVEIPRLDADNLHEAILGPAQKLGEHFNYSFDEKVVDQITTDLLRDTKSPIAPTLQVLLTQLWNEAEVDAAGHREITALQYDELGRKQERFKLHIQQRLRGLSDKPGLKEAVDSGLALDLLYQCTTPARTARAIAKTELEQLYGIEIRGLVAACIEARLLRPEGQDERKPTDVSLMHDTLGPIVWTLFRESALPGQKARRLLERLVEGQKDTGTVPRIDRTDLTVLLQGRSGMRKFEKIEEEILADNERRLGAEQAREAQSAKDLARAAAQRLRYLWAVGVLALLAMAGAAISYWYYLFAEGETRTAKAQTELADVKTAEAEVKTAEAERSAKHARDKQRWVAIRDPEIGGDPKLPGFGGNPTVQAALLREVELPEELQGWSQEVFRVLQRPIARAVLRPDPPGGFASPDGRYVLAIKDGSWRAMRVEDGSTRVIAEHGRCQQVHAFSPDGSKVATVCAAEQPEVWDLDVAGAAIVLPGHETQVADVTFSPDGRLVATTSWDGVTMMSNLADPGNPRTFNVGPEVGPGARPAARFSPDGALLVKNSSAAVEVLRLADHTTIHTISSGADMRFTANGQYLITHTAFDVLAWRVPSGPTTTLGSMLLEVSADNRRMLVRDGGKLRVVSTDDLSTLWELDAPKDPLFAYALDARGDAVVLGDKLGEVALWSAKNRNKQVLQEPLIAPDQEKTPEGREAPVLKVEFSPDGRRVVVLYAGGAGLVMRTDGQGSHVELNAEDEDDIHAAVFSPDSGRILALAQTSVRLWRVDESEVVELDGHDHTPVTGGFSGTDGRLWTIDDHAVRAWNVEATLPSIEPRDENFINIKLSADWASVVTIDADGTTLLRSRRDQTPETLRGPGDVSGVIAFSDDGKHVLLDSAGSRAVIREIDGDGGEVVLQGHTEQLAAAAFSADGTRVVTGSDDGTARLWQRDGRELAVLRHPNAVLAVGLTADGGRIVTGSKDGAVRVWLADGTSPITTLQVVEGSVELVTLSFGGDRILAVTHEEGEEGSVRKVWVLAADGSGERQMLTEDSGELVRASFSLDGLRVVAVTQRNIYTWFEGNEQPQVMDAERKLNAVELAVSRDGLRVATIDEWGNTHVMPICRPQECIEALWRATSYCLSAADRRARLGEDEVEAAAKAKACQDKVDRLRAQGAYR